MAGHIDPKDLAKLGEAARWKLEHGDVDGADNLTKLEQWVTKDTPTTPTTESDPT